MPKRLEHILAMPRETAQSPREVRSMPESFQRVCYDSGGTWRNTYLPGWKYPLDVWINREMLLEARPDSIVWMGTV